MANRCAGSHGVSFETHLSSWEEWPFSLLSLSEVPRKTSEMERAKVRQCSEYVKFRLIALKKQITPCVKLIDQR
jgi:hypothetical protein